MSDLVVNHPKKATQDKRPHMPSFFFGVVVTLVVLLVIQVLLPLFSTTKAQEPAPMPTAIVVQSTATKVPTDVPPTQTSTAQPTASPVPTEVVLTNEELMALTGVTIVKRGEVDDIFARYELLAVKASQDYLRNHEVISDFPPMVIEIADSVDYPMGCDFEYKNGVYVVHQNIVKCKNDRQPFQWMGSGANEAMNIYFQTSVGVDTYNEVSVAQWIWIEGSAEYFAWQALLEADLVTSEQAFHTTEMEDGQVYTVNDLLNSNANLGPNKSTNIGYHFMDFLLHMNGNDQQKINENIQKIYGVFVYLGKANVASEFNYKKMDEAVISLFGQPQSDLFASFLAQISNN